MQIIDKLNNQLSFDIFHANSHLATKHSKYGTSGGRCMGDMGNENRGRSDLSYHSNYDYRDCLRKCQRTKLCAAVSYHSNSRHCTLHRLPNSNTNSNTAYIYTDQNGDYQCYPLMEGIQIFI